jgi:hypothetical protein
MATLANSRFYVQRPGAQVPRYGLFQVANGPLDLPPLARSGGLEFQTATCKLPTGYEIDCPPSSTPKAFDSGGPDLIRVDPFVVRSDLVCAPVGLTDAQLRQWLLERLKAGEQAAVERIFSERSFGAAPGLTNEPGVATLDPSGSVTKAVANLESWLYARYGLPGVIHVPAGAAAYLVNGGGLYRDGNLWKTAMGSLLSFGNYAGTGPAGEAPAAGQVYLYITGQVTVWRAPDSEVFTTPLSAGLDRTTNQVYGQAEREYAVGYECFAASTLTTL